MHKLDFTDSDFSGRLESLINRPAIPSQIEDQVGEIIETVRREGDAALVRYAKKFDGADLNPSDFTVTPWELDEAGTVVSDDLRQAIGAAGRQLADFARYRVPAAWRESPRSGVSVGERFQPLSRIGAYVPGGTAPLISTALHTVTLAAVAGVDEIVLTTPPGAPAGKIDPVLLYAAREAGADQVLRLGGVYAIAALGLGTESIKKVEKVVGPGNAYVTAAKRQLYGRVALDMVAGPSEIMIVADEQAEPRWAAADMLSQIEHGSGHEQAVLVSDSETLLKSVAEELDNQVEKLSRADYIRQCMKDGVFLIRFPNLEEAVDFAGDYAPEHLELLIENGEEAAERIKAAGAIFIGPWTPEPVGDFVAGPSHVLPTGGAARFFSGLTVEQFYRRISMVKYEKEALRRELPAITTLAEAEGLSAHRRSAAIRFE